MTDITHHRYMAGLWIWETTGSRGSVSYLLKSRETAKAVKRKRGKSGCSIPRISSHFQNEFQA